MTLPPKPVARPDKVSLWRYMRLFRQDILSAQPARLCHAWMAEFRTPFFRSFLVNDPALLREVLKDNPDAYPKSDRIGAGLRPLLGNSVFLTNGAQWRAQRRIAGPRSKAGGCATPSPVSSRRGRRAATGLQPWPMTRPAPSTQQPAISRLM